jgi:RHS repeat-associated protein
MLVVAGILLLRFAMAPSAQAAECTDTWAGAKEGAWTTAANWSTGKVPSESDVACIGAANTPFISSGLSEAAVVQGEGGVLIKETGTLKVLSTTQTSTLARLNIVGTGTLTGPAAVHISKSLTLQGTATMSGAGSLTINSGATASVNGTNVHLNQRTMVNEGETSWSTGIFELAEGAHFHNLGTFEAFGATLKAGAGEAPIIENGGTLKGGTLGATLVEVRIENTGNVIANFGFLNLLAGGSGAGKWEGAGSATLTLAKGTFTIAGGTLAGRVTAEGASTSVSLENVTATTAKMVYSHEATVTIPSGTTTLKWLFMQSKATLAGAGSLRVSEELLFYEAKAKGSGSIVVQSGAKAELNASPTLSERTFVNAGTTSSFANLAMTEGAKIRNEGTFTFGSSFIELSGGSEIINSNLFKAESTSTTGIVTGTGKAKFVNAGTLTKTTGGTTRIATEVENSGPIRETAGKILIEHPFNVASSTTTPGHCHQGDPVDCATGNFTETQTDFEIGGRGVGLDLTRTYSAQAAKAEALGIFGYGWTNSFGDKLTSEEGGAKETLAEASGGTVAFTISGASYLAPSWSKDTLTGSAEAGFTLTLPDQTKEKFSGSGRLESVTDRNGNETALAYNGSGKLETITDPSGRKITLTYNAEGLVEAAKDPMGHEVKYAYEGKALKSVTLPGEASPSWQFKYDASHRMTQLTDGRGGKTTNEYDASSRVISQTDPAERKTTFEYAPFHTKITDKATGAVTDEWFTSNNEPVSVTHGFGTAAATTTSFTYTAAGLLASRTDGNGHAWRYGYDAAGNRTSESDPLEDETKWTYNEAHQVLSETKPSGEKTTIVRDANGNPETVSRPAPESKTQTVAYEYGPHGELKAMTDPLGHAWSYEYDSHGDLKAETDPEGDTRSWTYDEDSRVISAVSPRGNEEGAEAAKFTTAVERDARGRPLKVTDPLEGTTKYAYDADGNLESITDPNGRKTKFTYDADNERTKVERPNGAVEETGYDGAGQVTSQTDGNKHKTTYVRNILEQPVEVIDPLERKTTETFDAAGNLKTKKDPDGRTTTYAYDNANRLKEVSYSDGITPKASFGYDKDGNLTSMADGSGESTYEYDQLDRLVHSKDGNGDTVSWEYNLGNEPIGLTYPNGKSISRLYDKAGRLESLTDWLGNTTSFTYNKDSELRTTTFPEGTGDIDEYAFDRADRMSAVTFKKGAETLASLSYSRDKAGQVESLISKGLPGAEEESFGYDENERLQTAGAGSYEYDNANNITKAPGTTNAYDKASQLESATGATFSYDKEGERTKRTPSSGPATTYKYDQAGNLTAVERAEEGETPAIAESFAYDGTGLLASRTVGLSTKHLTWDPSEALPLLLSDGENSYLYGPSGLPIEQISAEEEPTYLHHDQLGSTRLLTNTSGEVAGSTTFAPYGVVAGKTGSASSPLSFAGQYTLGQSGLIYLRARFYDPATAQFLTVDPLVNRTRAPYGYAGDNPLRFKDPMGLWFAEELEGVGIPCPWCGAAEGATEALEEALGGAEWVLSHSLGAEELDEPRDQGEAEEADCQGTTINGYTRHGREQALGRDGGVGVSDEALEDAVGNPEEVIPRADGSTRYVGKDATVILNRDGEVITAWANNRSGWR